MDKVYIWLKVLIFFVLYSFYYAITWLQTEFRNNKI